ncbi:zinc finger protein 142 [Chanos chanos]|uniref:Zinc finger protein 142 n=1 Tax=Chanos chanos TaxID=29144 RepID=A0A6J2WGS7_CHACN|nr:zinc finger protein 142 [Chanos chanos]
MDAQPTNQGTVTKSAPDQQGGPQNHNPLPVSTVSLEEEETVPQSHNVKRSNKRVKGVKQSEKAPAITNQGEHRSKGHVVEGTEHLYRTHICSECRRCFKTRSHLLEHMHLHFPDPNLQCPTCKHYFTSKSKLRVHMLRESGQKLHRCHLCQYGAVERNSLHRHLASVHGQAEDPGRSSETYPCPACQKSFCRSQALKAHMKTHCTTWNGQPLRCFREGCSFQCTDKKELQKHATDAHGIQAVECRHHACSAFFGSRDDMEVHFRTHQAFHCPQCDFSCSNKSRFLQHKRQGHPGEQELTCGFCPFTTFNPVEFEQHQGHFHANEKIHRCQQCSFVTAHKRVLVRHMLMHTGEKPHKCEVCDFRCRDETYLSKHMLTHSDNKNYMCSECGYVTKWKHYLNVHMRKHVGDLRYKCDHCPYRCHRIDQLNSHKLRHQAKSLICEVCAYSCKRKSELRKHMQVKHSSAEETQVPVYQCKYCSYQTKYRQALHNHENCKHTRTREFRCALCSYTTFSNTGLFLHKRKVHGYMPGDVQWLENYAEKEREKKTVDLIQGFYSKAAAPTQQGNSAEEHARNQEDSENNTNDACQNVMPSDREVSLTASQVQGHCEQPSSNTSGPGRTVLEDQVDSDSVLQGDTGKIPDSRQADHDQEQCCTLVLTPITNTEGTECASRQSETPALDVTISDPVRPETARDIPQTHAESVSEEDDVVLMESEEQSDSEEQTSLSSSAVRERQESAEGDRPVELSPRETTAKVPEPEALLSIMRRQDKDQAEALVLEGRVQMLVVQTQASVYQCEHCSYVTSKHAALRLHKSSCKVRRAGLCCQRCGAKFKQQRGLDTHCLRKCPALRRNRRFSRLTTARTVMDQTELQSQPTGQEASVCRGPDGCSVTVMEQTESDAMGTRAGAQSAKDVVRYKTSETTNLKQGEGKHICKTCSFSTCREITMERHRATCGKSARKTKADEIEDVLELEDADREQREDGDGNSSRDTEITKRSKNTKQRFSCADCSFSCHQERALDSHKRRGCLKPGEIQCQNCSFVAKSQQALDHHTAVHKKEKNSVSPRSKKPRLQCQLCSFTCKQERRMTQHVSVKHEGVRPHRCRFCAFSTTRKHRLNAHESMHTGVGRHSCTLCDQTFSTASKLRLHRQRVHDRQPTHFCSLCDYSGYGPSDINRHTLSCHTGALSHPCDQCEAQFSSDMALKQHCNRKHQGSSSLSCAHCDFTCLSKASLKVHQQHQHTQLAQEGSDTRGGPRERRKPPHVYQCPVCLFTAHKRHMLAQHVLDEHEQCPLEEKPLKCDVCGFSCRHQLVFDQHIRSHGGTRLYKCTECEYSTRNKQKITWHTRIHTGEKPYHCEKCSYSCAEPSRLKYHMRIHEEERKYLCPECGYKCKWMSQLKYHMTRHTGAKPYACEECEYRTNRADALRIHRETRHCDERSFICEKCGKAFKTRYLLRTHQRKHSEERSYVCPECPRTFRWPAGLRHHYLSHSKQLPFRCLHCPYRAKQNFQVVRHIKRQHPDQPPQDSVGKDPGLPKLHLQRGLLRAQQNGEGERQDAEGAAHQSGGV